MTAFPKNCPIWDRAYEGVEIKPEGKSFWPTHVKTEITLMPDAPGILQGLGKQEKIRLSYWITDHRRQDDQPPRLDREQIWTWLRSRPSIEERSLSFIRELIDQSNASSRIFWFQYGGYEQYGYQQMYNYWKSHEDRFGPIHVAGCQALFSLLIASDCVHENGLHEFFIYAREQNWIDLEIGPKSKGYVCQIKLPARAFVEEKVRTRGQGRRGFMAMWFDCSMEEAWQNGFKPAIRKAGYEPYRVNEDHYTGLVYDKIIASIRQSRFVVADLTCNNVCDQDRARGNVYYEAGFAEGLNIPVILTCRHDSLANIHFDLKPHVTIVWRDAADLQKQLTLRIQRLLGQGPVPAPIQNEQDAFGNA